ncbi:MAG: GNAT family N-acetyltransferase [Defluviitaleaceae bacterium]|nr:GNAT family N-acetyltransferase [Defluviitaleaceae bacterium]
MIELIEPTTAHKQAVLDYHQEHLDNNETHLHGSAGFVHASSFESWYKKITMELADIPPEHVPSTTYLAMDSGKIIGMISVRHYLNDALLKHGGHIGYGIRPSERRKGYATKMLALALEKCRDLNIEKALVTCDKGNIGSAKTIINNGGVLQDELTEENGSILQRYWIAVQPI